MSLIEMPLSSTPDLLGLHQSSPHHFPFLLSSTAHHPQLGRYDILFAAGDEALVLDGRGQLQRPAGVEGDDFLSALDCWYAAERLDDDQSSSLPFVGGWFLFLSYELAGQIEPSLVLPAAGDDLPVACATRVKTAIIVDKVNGHSCLVGEQSDQAGFEAVQKQLASHARFSPRLLESVELQEEHEQRYRDAIERINAYILAGDILQVNISRQWQAENSHQLDPATLFHRLANRNPAPFAALAKFGETTIVSSSPERLLEVRGKKIQTRPIAGTRPRGDSAAEDRLLAAELIDNAKERAEHIMLIDLERNDLGRVCRPGSVEVDELMVVEPYAHVQHIVSNVCGRLRTAVTPGNCIAALFPGGTITGCPKVRCMEIIAELEQHGRGAYTGSLGYLNRDGSMDLNILIRTMVLNRRSTQFKAGGGIVADSLAGAEVAETRAKARGLVLALKEEG